MDWIGVHYCDVLSDSHSDGTHSLQSIHCWNTDAVTHFYKSDEEKKVSFKFQNYSFSIVEVVTLDFKDQFSLLTSCLLACILLAYWLLIAPYKANLNVLFCMTIF